MYNELPNPHLLQFSPSSDERRSEALQLITSIVFGLMALASTDIYWVTGVAVAVVIYSLIWYIESLGRGSAILQIMMVIASFQWLLGPIIAYHFGGETYKYRMYVDEETYMNFAVPAVIALLAGLRIIPAKVDLLAIAEQIKIDDLGDRYIYLLIFVGLASDLLVPYFPSSLLFVGYILSQFKFIGLLYFILLEHRHRWLFTFGVFFLSLISSAELGLFHGLILWSALIFSYICIALKLSRSKKLIILLTGMVMLVALQVVKADYRELIASGRYDSEEKVSLLMDMLLGTVGALREESSEVSLGELNARMNQGWIISAVMKNIHKDGDFIEGETVIAAFRDSFLPRFLSEKRVVRVSDNFLRFTGLKLNRTTSMGISILGEAYVNFGVFGGVIFMFFWGVFIALVMKFIVDLSQTNPTIVLWIPLVFLQMVKAETELVVVINHGVKTTIAILVFFWVTKKLLGWRI